MGYHILFQQYQKNQHGEGLEQIGRKYQSPISFARRQRGAGIGSIFSGLLKYLTPCVKSGLKTVGREVLRSGSNILQDLSNNNNNKQTTFKDILQKRGREGLNNLTNKGLNKLAKMGDQSGKGRLIARPYFHRKAKRKVTGRFIGIKSLHGQRLSQSIKRSAGTRTTLKRKRRVRKRMTLVGRGKSVNRRKKRSSTCKKKSHKLVVVDRKKKQTGGRKRKRTTPRKKRSKTHTRTLDIFDY